MALAARILRRALLILCALFVFTVIFAGAALWYVNVPAGQRWILCAAFGPHAIPACRAAQQGGGNNSSTLFSYTDIQGWFPFRFSIASLNATHRASGHQVCLRDIRIRVSVWSLLLQQRIRLAQFDIGSVYIARGDAIATAVAAGAAPAAWPSIHWPLAIDAGRIRTVCIAAHNDQQQCLSSENDTALHMVVHIGGGQRADMLVQIAAPAYRAKTRLHGMGECKCLRTETQVDNADDGFAVFEAHANLSWASLHALAGVRRPLYDGGIDARLVCRNMTRILQLLNTTSAAAATTAGSLETQMHIDTARVLSIDTLRVDAPRMHATVERMHVGDIDDWIAWWHGTLPAAPETLVETPTDGTYQVVFDDAWRVHGRVVGMLGRGLRGLWHVHRLVDRAQDERRAYGTFDVICDADLRDIAVDMAVTQAAPYPPMLAQLGGAARILLDVPRRSVFADVYLNSSSSDHAKLEGIAQVTWHRERVQLERVELRAVSHAGLHPLLPSPVPRSVWQVHDATLSVRIDNDKWHTLDASAAGGHVALGTHRVQHAGMSLSFTSPATLDMRTWCLVLPGDVRVVGVPLSVRAAGTLCASGAAQQVRIDLNATSGYVRAAADTTSWHNGTLDIRGLTAHGAQHLELQATAPLPLSMETARGTVRAAWGAQRAQATWQHAHLDAQVRHNDILINGTLALRTPLCTIECTMHVSRDTTTAAAFSSYAHLDALPALLDMPELAEPLATLCDKRDESATL